MDPVTCTFERKPGRPCGREVVDPLADPPRCKRHPVSLQSQLTGKSDEQLAQERKGRLSGPESSARRGQKALARKIEHYDKRAAKMAKKHGRGGWRAAKAAQRAQELRGHRAFDE